MLSLLEYSAKKEQTLQEYYAQLRPQFDACEPWEDTPTWSVLTGEVEVLFRETMHLYVNLLRADELHHYCAVTQTAYPYAETEQRFEGLFAKLHTLLQHEMELAEIMVLHGSAPKGKNDIATCLSEVELLLADESPVYTMEAFQPILQQSLDDIKAGRLVEMTSEQL